MFEKRAKDLYVAIDVLRRYGAKKIVLFGSHAKGLETSFSDFDFACEGIEPQRFFEALGQLLYHLERPVDLVDLSRVSEGLRRKIQQEGAVLYDDEKQAFDSKIRD